MAAEDIQSVAVASPWPAGWLAVEERTRTLRTPQMREDETGGLLSYRRELRYRESSATDIAQLVLLGIWNIESPAT